MPKPQHFLTKEEIQSVLDLKQKDAAVALSVSLASLKRYFQKFFPGQRWPRTPKERGKQKSFKARAELNSKLQSTINFIDEQYFNIPVLPLDMVQHHNPLNEPPLIDSVSSNAESESVDDPDSPRSFSSNSFGATSSVTGDEPRSLQGAASSVSPDPTHDINSPTANVVIPPFPHSAQSSNLPKGGGIPGAAIMTNTTPSTAVTFPYMAHVGGNIQPSLNLDQPAASNGVSMGMLSKTLANVTPGQASGPFPFGGGLNLSDPKFSQFPILAGGEPDPQFLDFAKKNYSDPNVIAQMINKLLIENASLQQEHQRQNEQILQLQQEIFCHQNDDPNAYVQFSSFQGYMANVSGPWQTESHLIMSSSLYAGFVIDRYFNLVACTERFHDLTGHTLSDCYRGINLMQGFMRLFSCRHYINLLKKFSTSTLQTIEFNESCKRQNGSLVHLRVLLKRADGTDPPLVWGWAKEIDTFLDYILVDGKVKIDARITKKSTSKYTEDDALVAHMLTNKILRDALEPKGKPLVLGAAHAGVLPER